MVLMGSASQGVGSQVQGDPQGCPPVGAAPSWSLTEASLPCLFWERRGRGLGRHTAPPPSQPLSWGREPSTPVPGLGWLSRPAWLQGCTEPKQRPARAHTTHPHPSLTQGPGGPAGPQRRCGSCSCKLCSILGGGRGGRTAFAQINSLLQVGKLRPKEFAQLSN